jgi:N-acetylmuramoyl-L-alanine amidase
MYMRFFSRLGIFAVAVSILSAQAALSEPAPPRREVMNIRHWTAPDHTRVVIDMSSECTYEVSERKGPDRVVIDIPRGRVAANLRRLSIADGVVDRVRINRLSGGAQVVLDLPARTTYRHFALKPNKVHPRHRIVIDIHKSLTTAERRRNREKAKRVAHSGDYIVVIDPGHGGSKPGAPSRYGPSEKYYTLPISKMIAEEIEKHQGFKTVLTRTGDYDVGLYRRIEIAKRHGGHCFVSVHLNSNRNRKLRGAEVYYLTLEGTSDRHAASVSEKENMDFGEDIVREELNGDVEEILYNMLRNNAYNMSSLLASHIAENLGGVRSIPFRGIRQGNILVLRGIEMPSVLVEFAYLSNKSDVSKIKKKSVQREVAKAVASGVVSYLLENPPEGSAGRPVRLSVHTVSVGETLSGIAKMYGCSVKDIKTLNDIRNTSLIRPGQKLTVYAKAD